MSVLEWVATALVVLIWMVMLAGTGLHLSTYPKRRTVEPAPEPPTLSDVYAFAMGHWDKQFYAVLEDALPGVCNCDPYPFSCPIHARPPEKTYDLSGIHRHIENNRRLGERRRAREGR